MCQVHSPTERAGWTEETRAADGRTGRYQITHSKPIAAKVDPKPKQKRVELLSDSCRTSTVHRLHRSPGRRPAARQVWR